MPDAAGNIKGIALGGKAGEVLEKIKIKAQQPECLAGVDCEECFLECMPCPDDEVCRTCPCADEDDVCLPIERARLERRRPLTEEQAEFVKEIVVNRKPLPELSLPIED